MRIAIDARALTGNRTGGGRYVYHLSEELARLDGENEYWLCSHREFGDKPAPEGSRFHYRTDWYPLGCLWQNIGLPRVLAGLGIQLFHSALFTLPMRVPCPSVVTVFDLTPHLFPEWHTFKVRLTIGPLLARSVKRARLVIVLSEATKRDLVRLMGVEESKIRVIPLGVDERFRPRAAAEPKVGELVSRLSGGRSYILHVGTIEPRKNLGLLLAAYGRARKRLGPDGPRLVLAGTAGWGYRGLMREIQSSPVREDIVLTGYVAEEELPYLYNGASLVVYPSFYEGFGLPPLEAMASGVPVAVSESSSLPEVTGDAALLLDPRDEQAWEDAIVRLLEDEHLRLQLVERGLERAKVFSWQRTARETLKAYREATGTDSVGVGFIRPEGSMNRAPTKT